MPRITRIDNYIEAFPSYYGLEGDGTCYSVITPFFLSVLQAYVVKGQINNINYSEPLWEQYECKEGDLITCNSSGCYIQPLNSEYYVPCEPKDLSKPGEPSFNKFPEKFLKKLGKELINSVIMGFEERKNMTFTSGL